MSKLSVIATTVTTACLVASGLVYAQSNTGSTPGTNNASSINSRDNPSTQTPPAMGRTDATAPRDGTSMGTSSSTSTANSPTMGSSTQMTPPSDTSAAGAGTGATAPMGNTGSMSQGDSPSARADRG